MVGWLAAPKLIIIHTGQIIVDEAVGMKHFDRAGDRHSHFHISAGNSAELQHQHGADPFSAGKKAIAHSLSKSCLG